MFSSTTIPALVACWIAATYFHPLFTAFPRLSLTGPKGSGKSKVLQVTAAVSFNGLHLLIPTAATVFRLVEPLRPTLCFDEMEKLDKSDAPPIKELINAGYKAGATVPRTEGDAAKREVVLYNAYAPMALAGIKGLDDVLADRAITIPMQPGIEKAKINAEVDPADPAYDAVRAMGYRLALTKGPAVREALSVIRQEQDSFTILQGRPLEFYRPLMAIALLASNDPMFLDDLEAAVQDERGSRNALEPDAAWLFGELHRRLRGADSIRVTPGQLVANPVSGNPPVVVTPQSVGRLLKSYGLGQCSHSRAGAEYTIHRAKFTDQASRYGYAPDVE